MRVAVLSHESVMAAALERDLSAAGQTPLLLELSEDPVSELLEAGVVLAFIDVAAEASLAAAASRSLRQSSALARLKQIAVVSEQEAEVVRIPATVDEVDLYPYRPGELEAKLRLVEESRTGPDGGRIAFGDVVIDSAAYEVTREGVPVPLTFKEQELLHFLSSHPDRVFSRSQLLTEVWGYDYFGGTRTVDVHIRRLRFKLGPEMERRIQTVRNVGYKFASQI